MKSKLLPTSLLLHSQSANTRTSAHKSTWNISMAGVRVGRGFLDMATCIDLYTGGTLASD